MLSNLIFSLERVSPYFFLIALGVLFRAANLAPRDFFVQANRFTFKVALPFQLFSNISTIQRTDLKSGGFMLYVFAVTLISFFLIWAVTELVYRDRKELIGTLVQGGFRGNFVLLGAPLASAVLGPPAVHAASLAAMIAIPSYNALSVIVLSARGKGAGKQSVLGVLYDIIRNPLIIGICLALPFVLFNIRLPSVAQTTIGYVGATGTPLGLISIGGVLNWSDVYARLKPALYASLIKTLILPASVTLISCFLGLRNEELLVILVLAAAPVAVSSYAMASEMGGDAPLASNILILSTFFSGFVLAFGIYALKAFALI